MSTKHPARTLRTLQDVIDGQAYWLSASFVLMIMSLWDCRKECAQGVKLARRTAWLLLLALLGVLVILNAVAIIYIKQA